MQKGAPKKNWLITSGAFEQLLDWLDKGENSDELNYLEMRRRMVTYFDRKNCATPEELADETLNRVARRLEEGEIESESAANYCYLTARFVFFEYLRETDRKNIALDGVLQQTNLVTASDDKEAREVRRKMLDCLEQCTSKLEPANRGIIVSYYFETQRVKIENRRALAQRLEISVNALSIRACRIRENMIFGIQNQINFQI